MRSGVASAPVVGRDRGRDRGCSRCVRLGVSLGRWNSKRPLRRRSQVGRQSDAGGAGGQGDLHDEDPRAKVASEARLDGKYLLAIAAVNPLPSRRGPEPDLGAVVLS